MSPPVIRQTNSSIRRQRNSRPDIHAVTFDRGREGAPNASSDTLRENEITHANTAALKGFDLSIRATPKIAMTERSITQNGYLKPDTQGPKNPPPPTDETTLDRREFGVQHESFFECGLTLSCILSAGNKVPGSDDNDAQTKAL
jgi:hypothetical protein